MNLLTDEEINALIPDKNCKLCFPGGELKYHGEDRFEPFARAIEAAVLERLTKVDVEPQVAEIMQLSWLYGLSTHDYRWTQAKQDAAKDNLEKGVRRVFAALRAENKRLKDDIADLMRDERYNELEAENERLKAEKMLDYTSLYDKYGDALAEVQELHTEKEMLRGAIREFTDYTAPANLDQVNQWTRLRAALGDK